MIPAGPVSAISDSGGSRFYQAIFEELRRLGDIEGQNLIVERYSGEGRPERFADLAREVVSRNPDGTYVTRGDANPSADSTPVPPGNVQGMARLRVPWIGLLVYWARQRAWTSLVAVAVVLGAGTVLTRPAQPVGRHRYRPARQDGVRA